jgi:hypothetical protein
MCKVEVVDGCGNRAGLKFSPRDLSRRKREEARSDCRREDGNDSSDDGRETVLEENHCHSLCVPFWREKVWKRRRRREERKRKIERGEVR